MRIDCTQCVSVFSHCLSVDTVEMVFRIERIGVCLGRVGRIVLVGEMQRPQPFPAPWCRGELHKQLCAPLEEHIQNKPWQWPIGKCSLSPASQPSCTCAIVSCDRVPATGPALC